MIKLNECFTISNTEMSPGQLLLPNTYNASFRKEGKNQGLVIRLAYGPSTHLQLAPESRLAGRQMCVHKRQKQKRQIKVCGCVCV